MKRQGFTLIELLVVMSIISLLISLLMPALAQSRAVAKTTTCAVNMRSMGQAMDFYTNDWRGVWPPLPNVFYLPDGSGNLDQRSWIYRIIPYVGTGAGKASLIYTYASLVQNRVFWCPSARSDYTLEGGTNWVNTVTIRHYGLNANLSDARWQMHRDVPQIKTATFVLMGEINKNGEGVNSTTAVNNDPDDSNNGNRACHMYGTAGNQGLENFLFCDYHVAPFANLTSNPALNPPGIAANLARYWRWW